MKSGERIETSSSKDIEKVVSEYKSLYKQHFGIDSPYH